MSIPHFKEAANNSTSLLTITHPHSSSSFHFILLSFLFSQLLISSSLFDFHLTLYRLLKFSEDTHLLLLSSFFFCSHSLFATKNNFLMGQSQISINGRFQSTRYEDGRVFRGCLSFAQYILISPPLLPILTK